MKKFTAILMTLALMLSLCVTAGAVTNAVEGENSQDVSIDITQAQAFAVTITWTGMTFAQQATWDSANHRYVTSENWTSTGSVTVTNNSNIGITYTAAYNESQNSQHPGVNIALEEEGGANLAEGVSIPAATAGAQNSTFTVNPSGAPDGAINGRVVIGRITVTISKTT